MSRRGFTVALVGPDGAGKTTVARRLEGSLPLPVIYLYMGVNPDSSNLLLPTTRLVHTVRRRRAGAAQTPSPRPVGTTASRGQGGLRFVRSLLRLANRVAEEWHRQALASWHVRRGSVVIFDRHFLADFHASDVIGRGRPLDRRLHGFLLSHAYPKPDLVVYLDAPASVLYARKGEGTLESLERRRQEYLGLADVVRRLVVVEADRPLEAVVEEVGALVRGFAAERNGGAR